VLARSTELPKHRRTPSASPSNLPSSFGATPGTSHFCAPHIKFTKSLRIVSEDISGGGRTQPSPSSSGVHQYHTISVARLIHLNAPMCATEIPHRRWACITLIPDALSGRLPSLVSNETSRNGRSSRCLAGADQLHPSASLNMGFCTLSYHGDASIARVMLRHCDDMRLSAWPHWPHTHGVFYCRDG
jgi:hypothetical protein